MTRKRIQGALGFTLLETMVVVALLTIAAAMAIPTLLPIRRKMELDHAGEAAAAFGARVRSEALASRRCTRLIISSASDPIVLVGERLNAWDCDSNPLTAPRINGAAPNAGNLWIEFARWRLDRPGMSIAFNPVPIDTAGGGPGSSVDEIRYRPTGRLFNDDVAATDINDDGMLTLTHGGLPPEESTKSILFEGHGPICVLARGEAPITNAPGDYQCPP